MRSSRLWASNVSHNARDLSANFLAVTTFGGVAARCLLAIPRAWRASSLFASIGPTDYKERESKENRRLGPWLRIAYRGVDVDVKN